MIVNQAVTCQVFFEFFSILNSYNRTLILFLTNDPQLEMAISYQNQLFDKQRQHYRQNPYYKQYLSGCDILYVCTKVGWMLQEKLSIYNCKWNTNFHIKASPHIKYI